MKLYKNILTKQEQKDLLKFVKSEVKVLGDSFPGLQTESNLHYHPKLYPLLKKIKKYYKNYKIIKNKSRIGTMFQKENKILVTECEENSLFVFDGKEIHSPPCHLPEERYVITFDLINE